MNEKSLIDNENLYNSLQKISAYMNTPEFSKNMQQATKSAEATAKVLNQLSSDAYKQLVSNINVINKTVVPNLTKQLIEASKVISTYYSDEYLEQINNSYQSLTKLLNGNSDNAINEIKLAPIYDCGITFTEAESIMTNTPISEKPKLPPMTLEEFKIKLGNILADENAYKLFFELYWIADNCTSYEYKIALYQKMAEISLTITATGLTVFGFSILFLLIHFWLRDYRICQFILNFYEEQLVPVMDKIKDFL